MSQDPPRLDLDGGVPDLANALRRARRDAPGAARLDAIEAGVLAHVPPAGQQGSGDGGASGAAKMMGVMVAGVAAIGALVALASSHEPPVHVAAPPAPITFAAPIPSSAAPTTIPSLAVSQLPSAPNAPTSAITAAFDGDSEAAEIALLDAAQAALAKAPHTSLARCAEHARKFARGALVQEREVIAIDALLRLDRRTEAKARADRFAKSYPRSGHVRRVEALLAR